MAVRFALRPVRRAISVPAIAHLQTSPVLFSRIAQFRPASTTASEALDAPAPSKAEDAVRVSAPAGPAEADIDWTKSYRGLATEPFSKEIANALTQPITETDIEVKPDGICYLPEIKYRRILHQAFGPGGWGLVPRGPVVVGDKVVTRDYVLVAHGRFISQAQGENPFFSPEQIPSAVEGCKSNALMRCCKDLGVASELWDPVFLRDFKKKLVEEIWVEHVTTNKRRQIWVKSGSGSSVAYPYRRVNLAKKAPLTKADASSQATPLARGKTAAAPKAKAEPAEAANGMATATP